MTANPLNYRPSANHVPEPLVLYQDPDGTHHFATNHRPWRTIVDVHNLLIGFGGWLKVDSMNKTITVSLDGEVLVYRRIGKDIHGLWICDRVTGDDDKLHGSDPAPDSPQAEVA